MTRYLGIVVFSLLITAFGIAGRWDYEEARRVECDRLGLSYNPKLDKCYKEPRDATSEEN